MKSIEIQVDKLKKTLQYLEDTKKQLESYKKKIKQQYDTNKLLRSLITAMKEQIQSETVDCKIKNKFLEESHMWQNSYYLERYPFFIDKKFPEKTTLNLISTNNFVQLISNVIPQKLFPSYFPENEIQNFLCNNQSMITNFHEKTKQLPNLEIMLFWTLTCINSFCIHFEKIISYHVNTLPTLGVVFLSKNLDTNVLPLYIFQYLFELENILTLDSLFRNDQAKKTLWDYKRKVYSCCLYLNILPEAIENILMAYIKKTPRINDILNDPDDTQNEKQQEIILYLRKQQPDLCKDHNGLHFFSILLLQYKNWTTEMSEYVLDLINIKTVLQPSHAFVQQRVNNKYKKKENIDTYYTRKLNEKTIFLIKKQKKCLKTYCINKEQYLNPMQEKKIS